MTQQIDTAAERLIALKLAEHQATAARIEAEAALLALVQCPDEGSKTYRGLRFKVTVTGNVSRRVDEAALAGVRERLGESMFERAFRFKPEVSVTGIKYLRDNEPQLYAVAAEAIVATPGKSSVKAEELVGAELKEVA
jgi:hypothetical protein